MQVNENSGTKVTVRVLDAKYSLVHNCENNREIDEIKFCIFTFLRLFERFD